MNYAFTVRVFSPFLHYGVFLPEEEFERFHGESCAGISPDHMCNVGFVLWWGQLASQHEVL